MLTAKSAGGLAQGSKPLLLVLGGVGGTLRVVDLPQRPCLLPT